MKQIEENFETGSHNFSLASNGTTHTPCNGGHRWVYAGSQDMNMENLPCECGDFLFHQEPCACCGQKVLKPIPVKK